MNELVLSNPHIERIYRVGRRDLAQLHEDERPQFRLLLAHIMNMYETMFLQYRRGTLDEEYWNARMVGLRAILSQPGIRAHWLGVREQGLTYARVPAFKELVDSLIDSPSDQHDPT